MKNAPKSQKHKLCCKCLALSVGVVWGLAILLTGWIAMTGWGYQFVSVISSLYTGYDASFVGGIVGGIWGFFIGAILGGAIGCVYNKMMSR
ncbi:hypothetical protein [Candidatus Neptunichlamydia sp. REUL1]|uniref:hypothetical protein n=1 Tax=Candidatus Neptunichlamydia sp. REUL1 TaxID=3064277 RepID=UPI00292E4E56|nr:hypothetical protein [Candidatus Neptunochlamydia sp. REUL1]